MAKKLQIVETYDTFRPDFLLSIDAHLVDLKEPAYVKTCRSAYLSLRHFTDGALTHLYQDELPLDDRDPRCFPRATYCNEVKDEEAKLELDVSFWEQSRQC